MFSQDYIVLDKHSLMRGEYVSTLEKMPWVYTSLKDSRYLPVLDNSVASKLKSFFSFEIPARNHEPLYDSRKILIIEHNGGDIISFDCRTEMQYHTIFYDKPVWRFFKRSILLFDELTALEQKINKMTSVTDAEVTKIVGVKYNADASFQALSIFDSSYDLNEYSGNETLAKINQLCSDNDLLCRGVISLPLDSTDVSFKFVLNYPHKLEDGKIRTPVENYREHYVNMFLENNLINEDQAAYIRNLLVGKTKFELEFLVSEEGDIKDIFVYHYRIYEFEDLTTA